MRLLIAEDDAKLSSALARGLRGEGYAIDVASTGTRRSSRLVSTTTTR